MYSTEQGKRYEEASQAEIAISRVRVIDLKIDFISDCLSGSTVLPIMQITLCRSGGRLFNYPHYSCHYIKTQYNKLKETVESMHEVGSVHTLRQADRCYCSDTVVREIEPAAEAFEYYDVCSSGTLGQVLESLSSMWAGQPMRLTTDVMSSIAASSPVLTRKVMTACSINCTQLLWKGFRTSIWSRLFDKSVSQFISRGYF